MDQFAYEPNNFREKVGFQPVERYEGFQPNYGYEGFQPVYGYEGFRPTPARHFRQNTWGSGYQVIIKYIFRVIQSAN